MLACLGVAGIAHAQEATELGAPPPPPQAVPAAPATNPFPASVSYGRIDNATVRVFAVQSVDVANAQGRYVPRTIALPVAGHGTGVIVDPRGVILTAAHVVENARHVAVRLPGDGGVYPAVVIRRNDALDFAFLLIKPDRRLEHFLELPENANPLSVRQTVDAIGYPLDANRSQPQSTRGIISGALDDSRLQLGISVNPGNSGGPLVNEQEELVGMVVARGDPREGVQGIGIAVPIQPIRSEYELALQRGEMHQAHRALETQHALRVNAALVVDALVRFGGVEVLLEAADVVATGATPERLDRFARLSESARDPDLLALLAGYFWDAMVVMLERAGGAATAAQLTDERVRALAMRAEELARSAAQRAMQADPNVATRNPFLASMNASTSAGVVRPYQLRQPREPDRRWGYRPIIWAGAVVAQVPGTYGYGWQAGVAFPLYITGDRSSPARIAPTLGFSIEWQNLSDSYYSYLPDNILLVGSGLEVGFAARIGRRIALIIQPSWTIARITSSNVTAAAGRILMGVAFGRFLVSFAGRIAKPKGWDRPYGSSGFAMGMTY